MFKIFRCCVARITCVITIGMLANLNLYDELSSKTPLSLGRAHDATIDALVNLRNMRLNSPWSGRTTAKLVRLSTVQNTPNLLSKQLMSPLRNNTLTQCPSANFYCEWTWRGTWASSLDAKFMSKETDTNSITWSHATCKAKQIVRKYHLQIILRFVSVWVDLKRTFLDLLLDSRWVQLSPEKVCRLLVQEKKDDSGSLEQFITIFWFDPVICAGMRAEVGM